MENQFTKKKEKISEIDWGLLNGVMINKIMALKLRGTN